MLLDQSRFPLVFLRSALDAGQAAEAQLEALLDREEPFVLITDHSPSEAHDESAEERKQRALFFKRNKDRLRRLCAGAIVIEGEKPAPAAFKLTAQTAAKAFGFPLHFVASEAEVMSRALRLVG